MLSWVIFVVRQKYSSSSPLGGASVYAAWRAQYLRRLADPVMTPLGGPSIYPAWRTQRLRRLASPSVYAAWRAQYLRRLARVQYLSRLAGPVFTPLGGPSVYVAWRAQCLRRLASPVLMPLGGPSVYPAWRTQRLSRLARALCLSRLARAPYLSRLAASPVLGVRDFGRARCRLLRRGANRNRPAWRYAECLPIVWRCASFPACGRCFG